MTNIDNEPFYGTDIHRDMILLDEGGNFLTVSDIENAEQMIYNRLQTEFGEFELFEYTDFFNLSFDWLMHTDVEASVKGVELNTIECLQAEPVVKNIVNVEVTPRREGSSFELIVNINVILVNNEDLEMVFVFNESGFTFDNSNDIIDSSDITLEE